MRCQMFYSKLTNDFEEVDNDLVRHEPSIICDPESYSTLGQRALRRKLFESVNSPRGNERLLKSQWRPSFDADVETITIY